MKENEKKWLVKSANRVHGPHTLNEVIGKVRDKQISIIDEVRTPEQRWTYIRDSLLFLEVVKEIREEQEANSENTVNSKTATIQTRTSEMDRSITPTENILDSVRQDLNADVKTISPIEPEKQAANNTKSKPVVYTTFEPEIKKSSSSLMWVILVVFLAAGAGFFGYQKYLDQQIQSQLKTQVQRVYYLKSIGLYQKALELYKTLPMDSLSDDLEIEMLPIQIQMGNQPYVIRKSAEDRLKKGDKPNKKMELSLVVFLGLMTENDSSNYPQAKKMLQELIALDPNSDFLKMNDALLDLRMGKFNEANKKFKSLIASSMWGYSLYARAQIMISYIKKNLANEFTVINEINNYLSDVSDYFKANHLFLVSDIKILTYYILVKTNQLDLADKYLSELLDSPLRLDEAFSKEILIDWSYYRKQKDDKSLCLETFPEQANNYRVLLGRFICHFESGKLEDAQQLLTTASQNAPQAAEIANLQAQMVMLSDESKLQNVLAAFSQKKSETANYINAKICFQQKNLKCFKEAYEAMSAGSSKLYKIPMMQLASEFAMSRNLTAEGLGYLREIISIEPYYKPALILRDSIESKK